ncbi:N-6 DNA methylase [Haloimpatiens sp. FM7315]|uniref:type I restriction-modification system subunit M n=1 Tax=Haloimpatiens sp. FM7315 TaxID=3298609 RepID=UPI0035A38415
MAKKEKKKVSMEAGLWAACNKLRGSVSATDYVNVVLGLLFLRFAYDKFNAQRERLLANDDTKDFVDNPKFYSRDNVFYLEEHDRWDYIKDNSKKNTIFTIIDDAFKNLEKNNVSLKGALPIGFYISLRIEAPKFSSLIDEVHKLEYSQDESDDVIGRVYEYFLRKFCIAAKSEKGEFYTPANIVELMTMLIQPYNGSVYDPCCGSGGMFVQSAEFIKKHQGNKKDITIYGQESNDKTYKLARMNLAIRGLNCNLGDEDASTFTRDKHPDLRADYILANPPFNLKDWRTANQLTNDGRWHDYELPPISNANYAWVLHMLSRLSYNGTAAFLLANGALNADSEEYKIRKQLIENNKVEAIIVLPRNMFYATDISVTLWIIGNHKKPKKVKRNDTEVMLRNRENEILFIDARTLGDGGNNEDGYVLLTDTDKEKIASTLFAWQSPEWKTLYKDIPEFCYSAAMDEIRQKDYALVPSKYISFVDHDLEIDFETEMSRIQSELKALMVEERQSQAKLEAALEGIGYGIK